MAVKRKVSRSQEDKMFRLALTVVLIVAIVASRDEEGAKRDRLHKACYGSNHPFLNCFYVKSADYTVLTRVYSGTDDFAERKQILQEENALEDLCSDLRSLAGCLTDSLESATEECKEEYEYEILTERIANATSFLKVLCTEDFIEKVRRNLDCEFNEELLDDVVSCRYENPDHDCSQFETSEYTQDNEIARFQCYSEKYSLTCDVDKVVNCAAENVVAVCGEEAGELVELAGYALFERFRLCPNERIPGSLLSFFKK